MKREHNLFNNISLTERQYIVQMIMMLAVFGLFYWGICFRPLHGTSYTASVIVLLVSAAILLTIELFAVIDWNRNMLSAFICASLVYSLYNAAAYFGVFIRLYLCVLIGASLLSTMYLYALLSEKNKKRGSRSKKDYLRQGFLAVRTIFAVALMIPLVRFGCMLVLDGQLSTANRESRALLEIEADTPLAWDTLFEEAGIILEDRWMQLPVQKKLDKLQSIADFECVRQGIPFEVKIGAASLDEKVLAIYRHETKSISFDFDTLRDYSGSSTLHVLMHEMAHTVQSAQVELYRNTDDKYKQLKFFAATKKYAAEFENYNGSGGEAYANQSVEQDAEKSAESIVTFYAAMYRSFKAGKIQYS